MAPARRNATTVAPPMAWMPYQRPIMKRVQSELEIVRGLLSKAKALVASKRSHGGAAAAAHSKVRPRHRLDKSKRLLHHPDARPEATDGAAGSKSRRTSPLVEFPGTPRSSSSESSSSSSSSSGSSSSDSASETDDDGDDTVSSTPDTAAHLPIETVTIPLEQQDKKLTERAASPATDMRELIARAQEKHKLRRELNRKRAREELEETERTARSMSNSIDPVDVKLLGISAVEYNVSPVKSRNSVRRRGSLLQQLGFFLKPEC
ncbi:hypothetical protein ABZP36_013073 [Zizania latifolia]